MAVQIKITSLTVGQDGKYKTVNKKEYWLRRTITIPNMDVPLPKDKATFARILPYVMQDTDNNDFLDDVSKEGRYVCDADWVVTPTTVVDPALEHGGDGVAGDF